MMITTKELIGLAKVNRSKPYQQEKHYLQTATLSGVYTAIADELVFKGGTALFFFYGLDRFSEGLDFTRIKQYDQDKLKKTISNVLTVIHIIHEIKTEKSLAGKTFKVKARGPLYKGPLSESTISIEISDRNDVVLPPDIKEIVPVYDDLRPFTVPVMKKEEILAEKIRALMIRGRARDLYDIAFLLKKGISLEYDLINKKLVYYKKTFDEEEFTRQAKSIKNLWQSELHGLVPKIPVFDDALHFILNQLKH
jgi:predicted nucleotidyltransferase component of viral defense system